MVRDYNAAFKRRARGKQTSSDVFTLFWNPIKATAEDYKTFEMLGFKTSLLSQQLGSRLTVCTEWKRKRFQI